MAPKQFHLDKMSLFSSNIIETTWGSWPRGRVSTMGSHWDGWYWHLIIRPMAKDPIFQGTQKKSQHKFIIDSKPWRSIRWINDDKWIDHNRLRRLTKLKWVPRRNSKNCVMGSLRQSLSCWKSNRGPMMLVNHQIPSIVHLCTATRPGKRLQVAIEAMTQSK